MVRWPWPVLCVLLAGCEESPPPPPPPAPPPLEETGGPYEYEDVSLPCRAERVEVRDPGLAELVITYQASHGPDPVTASARVPPDRIEEARELYLSTPGTCHASVITQGSCPDVSHEWATPPPFPPAQ